MYKVTYTQFNTDDTPPRSFTENETTHENFGNVLRSVYDLFGGKENPQVRKHRYQNSANENDVMLVMTDRRSGALVATLRVTSKNPFSLV